MAGFSKSTLDDLNYYNLNFKLLTQTCKSWKVRGKCALLDALRIEILYEKAYSGLRKLPTILNLWRTVKLNEIYAEFSLPKG